MLLSPEGSQLIWPRILSALAKPKYKEILLGKPQQVKQEPEARQRLSPSVINIPEHSMWFLSVQMKKWDSTVHNTNPLLDIHVITLSILCLSSIFSLRSLHSFFKCHPNRIQNFWKIQMKWLLSQLIIIWWEKTKDSAPSIYNALSWSLGVELTPVNLLEFIYNAQFIDFLMFVINFKECLYKLANF